MNKRIEVTGRRSRIFLAHRAIALGWALKGSCKVCANRLFAIAGWLVPETQRFLVLRTGSHEHPRRIMKFAADVRTLLSPIVPLKVVAGALIVLVLLGSLELVTRATAITTRPFGGDSAFQLGSQSYSIAYKETPKCLQRLGRDRSDPSHSKKSGSAKKCAAQAKALSVILSSFCP